jgi:hypothetical protein
MIIPYLWYFMPSIVEFAILFRIILQHSFLFLSRLN